MLEVIEDSGGNLYLFGEAYDGRKIHYGRLEYSAEGCGVNELTSTFWSGVDSWHHDIDADGNCLQCGDLDVAPIGKTVAQYDGETLTLDTEHMGSSAESYFNVVNHD